MKKVFSLVTLLCAMFVGQEAMADNHTFYAKCSVQVAEDCTGLGTVYLVDDNDQEVTETTGFGSAVGEDVTGQYVAFTYRAYPAEGYELKNFTDADGKEYEVGNDMFSVYATSEDEVAPTVFRMFAHFGPVGEVDTKYHFNSTVYSSIKFGHLVLPVDFTLPEGVKAYVINNLDGDVLVMKAVEDVVPAGTPVLLENTTADDINLKADFEKELLVEGLHTAGLLNGGYTQVWAPVGAFVMHSYPSVYYSKTETDIPVEAFDCYLAADTEATSLTINTNVTTALNDILTGAKEVLIFDASGRQLNQLHKGLNIVNGVKVLVK